MTPFGDMIENINKIHDLVFQKQRINYEDEKFIYVGLYRFRACLASLFEYLATKDIDFCLPILLEILEKVLPYKILLNQLLWVFINFTSNREICKDFIFPGYKFIENLKKVFGMYEYHDCPSLYENIYWLLGNLSSESDEIRNLVLSNDFITHLTYLMTEKNLKLRSYSVNTFTYCLFHIVRRKIPEDMLENFECITDTLKLLFYVRDDPETLDLALLTYKHLIFNAPWDSPLFDKLVDEEVIELFLGDSLEMKNNSRYTFTPKEVLSTLINITSGDNRYTTMLLQNNWVDYLLKWFYNTGFEIKILIMHCFQNMTDTSIENLQCIIDDQVIFTMLAYCFNTCQDTRLIINCIGCVNNIWIYADQEGVSEVIRHDLIKFILTQIHRMGHLDKIEKSLICFKHFLARTDHYNNCVDYFIEVKGRDIIEDAQDWIKNNKILDTISFILIKYFDAEGKVDYVHCVEEHSQNGTCSDYIKWRNNNSRYHF